VVDHIFPAGHRARHLGHSGGDLLGGLCRRTSLLAWDENAARRIPSGNVRLSYLLLRALFTDAVLK
jgi:hypothetical protein